MIERHAPENIHTQINLENIHFFFNKVTSPGGPLEENNSSTIESTGIVEMVE